VLENYQDRHGVGFGGRETRQFATRLGSVSRRIASACGGAGMDRRVISCRHVGVLRNRPALAALVYWREPDHNARRKETAWDNDLGALFVFGGHLPGCGGVRQYQRSFTTYAACWNGLIATIQPMQHLFLLAAGNNPENLPGAVQNRIGQGHSTPRLIDS